MSTLFGQLNKLQEQLGDITSEEFQQLLRSGIFPLFKRVVRERRPLPSSEDFSEFLGLGRPRAVPDITELDSLFIPEGSKISILKDEGEYDSQSDDARAYITDEFFKVTKFGSRKLCLAHFSKAVTSEYAKGAIERMGGYEMALIEDLLIVGASCRGLQRRFPIVALGSSVVARGCPRVPCIQGDEKHRSLQLYWGHPNWTQYCRFLIVRKEVALAA